MFSELNVELYHVPLDQNVLKPNVKPEWKAKPNSKGLLQITGTS